MHPETMEGTVSYTTKGMRRTPQGTTHRSTFSGEMWVPSAEMDDI